MSDEEFIENSSTEFNSGVATAMTVRELCNQAAIARMKKKWLNDGEFGYFDYLDSLYIELYPFMKKEKNEDKYADFLVIWIKLENSNNITMEEFQEVKKFEVDLRQIAKDLGILMPGKKDPRWGGY